MHNTENMVIEPATIEDLPHLTNLLFELFTQETDFVANREKQMRGLRLILENPNRGRIFILRNHDEIIGMINLLFTISTAEGGFVMLLEDLVIHPQYRAMGFGSVLVKYALQYAREKGFLRITLMTDNPKHESVNFFQEHGFKTSKMVIMRQLLSSEQSNESAI